MTNLKGWIVGKVYDKSELEKIAKERINEEPDKIETNIATIKDWIKQQPHLEENGRTGNSNWCPHLQYCAIETRREYISTK